MLLECQVISVIMPHMHNDGRQRERASLLGASHNFCTTQVATPEYKYYQVATYFLKRVM
jgi:hypothetical protein